MFKVNKTMKKWERKVKKYTKKFFLGKTKIERIRVDENVIIVDCEVNDSRRSLYISKDIIFN